MNAPQSRTCSTSFLWPDVAAGPTPMRPGYFRNLPARSVDRMLESRKETRPHTVRKGERS